MSENRSNVGALIGGATLIGIGLLVLIGQLFRGFGFWEMIWPFFVIGAGALFFVGMFAAGRSAAGLAIPGSIITMIGLILLLQNLTSHWESWSYAWALILVSVGIGIFIMGWYAENASQRESGIRLMKLGGILFLIFGGFFEMLFNSFRFSEYILPVVLILLGAYLLLARTGLLRREAGTAKDHSDISVS
ncbi:MAG: LiaF transmembrane domain-containing protein [Bacteroidota bacterium]